VERKGKSRQAVDRRAAVPYKAAIPEIASDNAPPQLWRLFFDYPHPSQLDSALPIFVATPSPFKRADAHKGEGSWRLADRRPAECRAQAQLF
jgi:hypothetical protein